MASIAPKRSQGPKTHHVSVSEFRRRLAHWIDRAGRGDEIVITDRGRPVAELRAAGARGRFAELVEQGIITPALFPKTPIDRKSLIKAKGSVSDLVKDQRR